MGHSLRALEKLRETKYDNYNREKYGCHCRDKRNFGKSYKQKYLVNHKLLLKVKA